MNSRALMRAAAAASAVAGTAVIASPAMATTSAGQLVSGTALNELSLTAGTPAAFTTFQPGVTASGNTATAALTAVNTNTGAWSLKVQDTANDGHMQAMPLLAGSTCTGSETELASALDTTVTNGLTGVASDGQVAIPGTTASAVEVANQGTSNGLLSTANAFAVTYGQAIGAGETLTTGCIYQLTATYTLG